MTLQPGNGLPSGQFSITIQAGRSYTIRPRVISPAGAAWLGVNSTAGVGPGTVGFFVTNAALGLPPGNYAAVIDILAGNVPVPAGKIRAAGPLIANSGVVCGGGLSSERLIVFLRVGQAPITVADLPLDSDTQFPLLTVSYSGGTLRQPAAIQFLSGIVNSAAVFNINTIVQNPDPANIPASNWLTASPASSTVPAAITPVLDSTAVNALTPCDYDGFLSISNNGTGQIVKIRLSVHCRFGRWRHDRERSDRNQRAFANRRWWTRSRRMANHDHPGKHGSGPSRYLSIGVPSGPGSGRSTDHPDAPFNIIGPEGIQNRMYTGTIPIGGSVTLATQGPGHDFWQGWASLTAPDTVGGTAIFAQALLSDPSSDSEGSVLLKPPPGTRLLLPFDNNTANGLLTTMALVNTSLTDAAQITVTFRDESGVPILQDQMALPIGDTSHSHFSRSSTGSQTSGALPSSSRTGPRSRVSAYASIPHKTPSPPLRSSLRTRGAYAKPLPTFPTAV